MTAIRYGLLILTSAWQRLVTPGKLIIFHGYCDRSGKNEKNDTSIGMKIVGVHYSEVIRADFSTTMVTIFLAQTKPYQQHLSQMLG